MNRKRDHEGAIALLARLPYQILRLARLEYENAKREVLEKVKRGGIGMLALVIALFFLFFALGALVAAAIAGLAVVWPLWLAALVVAAALVLCAAAAVCAGVMLMKRGVPMPEETLARVEEDLYEVGQVQFNASAHESPAHARATAAPVATRQRRRKPWW